MNNNHHKMDNTKLLIIGVFMVLNRYSTIGFNLESRIPVIKRGMSGSYFGYSVAEHQEEPENSAKSWILVGAPLDQNRQPGTNRSGALWQCPLTTNTGDCKQVITDGRLNIESDELIPPGNDEIKDGQWLGVTVRSQGIGGKVMVCAHRHRVKTADAQWGQGQCYILTRDLKYQDLKKPCSGKPTSKAHEQFGYCQAGTSGVLTSDDRVVIGTPGPHTWRGTLYLFTVSDDYLNRDSTVYHGPMQDQSPVDKYSYLGMSVTVGNFFGSGLAYASGAPRSNGTGQVVILTRHDVRPDMDVALILDGEQFASSFGYEIAAVDLNGDKKTDLVVSAPFYFNKAEGGAVYIYTSLCKINHSDKCRPTKLTGREESRFGFSLANLGDLNHDGYEDLAIGAPYEGKGTVYIYLGSKNGIITTPSQVIHSEDTPVPLKTFGYSLSGGIDMDKNGYPDLLIGAYENDAIALLRARKIIDITTFIRYSKNGSYVDKIEPIDPNKIGCSADFHSNLTCFSFETCCKTESLNRNDGMQNLKLNYYVEAETFSGQKKFSRVFFEDSSGRNKAHYLNRNVTLDATKVMHCQREIVYLKENTRDIQSPIKFRVNYTLIQDEPRMPREGEPLTDIGNYPILNQQEAARVFEASFQKDCGDNDICESDLRVEGRLLLAPSPIKPNFYELLLGEVEEVLVDITSLNIGESAYEAQLFISHSHSLNYIASKSNESLICNVHNSTLVICSLGNPFRKDNPLNLQIRFDPKEVEDNEPHLSFTIFANSTSHEINKKDPINLQAIVVKRAELSIKGSAKTQWSYYGGQIIGESAIKKLDQVGPKVSHMYEVYNEGPWKVKTIEVFISWPFEVANDKPHGKWLLYLEEKPTISHSGECFLPPGVRENPLNLLKGSTYEDLEPQFIERRNEGFWRNRSTFNHIRERRDTEKVVNTRIVVDDDGHRHQEVSMNCKRGTAKCFDIRCIIYNLERKQEATITVKARLWNSTLVEDYPRVDKVVIGSNARIVIPESVEIQQEEMRDDQAVAETIAYPDLGDQQDAEPVPIWIIILAIVAGLVLLVLLTIGLWKLGFFKRRRPDPTLSGNLEKHRDDNPEHEALFKH